MLHSFQMMLQFALEALLAPVAAAQQPAGVLPWHAADPSRQKRRSPAGQASSLVGVILFVPVSLTSLVPRRLRA